MMANERINSMIKRINEMIDFDEDDLFYNWKELMDINWILYFGRVGGIGIIY